MLGWLRADADLVSWTNRALRSVLATLSADNTLIATKRLKMGIAGFVHHAHPAFAKFLDNLEIR